MSIPRPIVVKRKTPPTPKSRANMSVTRIMGVAERLVVEG